MASTLVNARNKEGICAANGHPDAGISDAGWELKKKNSQLKYNTQGLAFNAHKKVLSISTKGNISTGTYSTTSTTLVSFRRNIKYADFDSATIFYKMKSMNRLCFFGDGYAEVRISLKSGFGHWISVLVNNDNLETFIASMMVAAPQTVIKVK